MESTAINTVYVVWSEQLFEEGYSNFYISKCFFREDDAEMYKNKLQKQADILFKNDNFKIIWHCTEKTVD